MTTAIDALIMMLGCICHIFPWHLQQMYLFSLILEATAALFRLPQHSNPGVAELDYYSVNPMNWNKPCGCAVGGCILPAPLTCQAVVALDLGALHRPPLLFCQLGRGLVQQVDLRARRPVDNLHPFELQQRPMVLADRFPEFLLFIASVAFRLEVDGFLDFRLHLHFSRTGPIPAAVSSGGRCEAPSNSLRVAFEALQLLGFHVS